MPFSISRRWFLGMLAAVPCAAGRTKISDVRVMVLQGPRTYTLVKVVSDSGVYGIGEGYGSPGVGVKAGVLELRPYFLGKDPLEIETLYSGLENRVNGSANMLLRSGTWPASCLGSRFRYCWAGAIASACGSTAMKGRVTCWIAPHAMNGRTR